MKYIVIVLFGLYVSAAMYGIYTAINNFNMNQKKAAEQTAQEASDRWQQAQRVCQSHGYDRAVEAFATTTTCGFTY